MEEFLQLDFITLSPDGFRGYEIKGDNDVLTRLTAKTTKIKRKCTMWEKNEHGRYDNKRTEVRTYEVQKQYGSQIEKYERICRYCHVLTTARHLAQVLEVIPSYWGIYIGSDEDIRIEREASENPNLKTRNVLNVLWLQELRDLSRVYFKGASRWTSAEHAQKLATVPNIAIHAYARIRDRFLLKEGRFELPRHSIVKAPEKFRERNQDVIHP
jgi:hypothetical protein